MQSLSAIEFRDAQLPHDIAMIRSLWFDYLTWGNDKMQMLHGVHPHHPKETVEQDIAMIDKFLPPYGRLILAFQNDTACGIGCLKRIDDEIGEIKRMYVDPASRKSGIGHGILSALIQAARDAGYKKIRLDSPTFMEDAHKLYRKLGFRDIAVYDEVEIPEEFRKFLLFMELDLI